MTKKDTIRSKPFAQVKTNLQPGESTPLTQLQIPEGYRLLCVTGGERESLGNWHYRQIYRVTFVNDRYEELEGEFDLLYSGRPTFWRRLLLLWKRLRGTYREEDEGPLLSLDIDGILKGGPQ